jgi:hypothetical protein
MLMFYILAEMFVSDAPGSDSSEDPSKRAQIPAPSRETPPDRKPLLHDHA